MNHIITHKWRSLAFLVVVATVTFGCFFLSNASAKQRRGAVAAADVTRTAIYVSGETATPASADGSDAVSAFAFSTAQVLVRPPLTGISILKDQDLEPEIKIDIFGNIYIAAIHGVPGGIDLWKSTDNGATFVYLGQPDGAQDKCNVTGTLPCAVGAGGGDVSMDLSSGGYLYVSSLYLGGTTVSTSFDGGIGGVLPGQAWQVNPLANGDPPIPVNDRQWLASYGAETVYMTFDQAPAPGPLWFVKSIDAGKTFSAPAMLVPAQGVGRPGNVAVDQYNGNIYTTYQPPGNPGQINFLKSTNGGTTWTATTPYTGPAGTSVENAFTILAVDRGGNLHLVFTRSTGTSARTNAHVFLMSSTDQGATWLPPVQVDSGANTQSTVMPWIVAGSPGVVDITWYGSSSASPDAPPYDWHVFFAQTTNALAAIPTFTQVLASPTQVHNDAICSGGGGCAGSTRDLAEYYAMTLDNEGNAHIAFVDGMNNCVGPPTSNCYAKTWYTKQISGQSAYTPPSAPGPATFAANVNVTGSSGKAEPNAWVDSHNCIFGGAIGGPTAFKSTNAGLSFTATNVIVGSGIHGGDFDIITLPKADGTRPDIIYTVDLGISSVHVAKSTNGGTSYAAPSATSGEVAVSSDRMWLASDRGVPTAADVTIYLVEHELASEVMRVQALTNDGTWSAPANASSAPELLVPPSGALPNTYPGPIFVNKTNHEVVTVFGAASTTTNAQDPPFGKCLNAWAAVGAPPAAAGLPPGPFTNYPAFKGLFDSPASAPSPAPSIPSSAATIGNHVGNLFPSGDSDPAGNIYVVWTTGSARLNTTQANGQPSTTFDVWFVSSHDGGKNYYGPWRVSSGTGTCVQPWIAAGDNGRVDIVWYQSSGVPPPLVADPASPGTLTGGSNAMPAGSTWHVMFAQSLNAASREPVFTVSQASDHIVHTGSISNGGLTGSSDRSLLDFIEVAIGPDGLGNIFTSDNGTIGLHINYMRQNSGPLAKASPSAVTCLPGPPIPVGAVSRKAHGSAGPFDIDLLPPAPGIECRTGGASGDFQMVVTFPLPVTVGASTMTTGTGSVVNTSVSGNVVTVNLTGVTNAQRITVSLNSVTDANGSGNVPVNMGVLGGDTTADTFVNSADISQTKSRSGQAVSGSNFRSDVTFDGFLNSADISFVKSRSGTALP